MYALQGFRARRDAYVLWFFQIKQRKAELANERGGLMASIGQTIAGPRFYETDEVGFP